MSKDYLQAKSRSAAQALIDKCALCDLNRHGPYTIPRVKRSPYAVARISGWAWIDRRKYIYHEFEDVLVREDVHKWLLKKDESTHEQKELL